MMGYELPDLFEAFSSFIGLGTNIGTFIAIAVASFSIIQTVYMSCILFLPRSASSRPGKQLLDLRAKTPSIAERKTYTLTKMIIASVIVGLLMNLGSAPFSYFIKALLEAAYGDSLNRNNICSEDSPKISTTNAVNAVYKFCVSIKNELDEQAKANFDSLDATGGFEGRAKMFLSKQTAAWSDICLEDYGIDLNARLRDGLIRKSQLSI